MEHTRSEMRGQVVRTLPEGTPDGMGGYMVEEILDDCYEAAGSWDFDAVDDDLFWEIVARHAR